MTEASTFHHRIRALTGRDPDEPNRSSSALELLFDLTIVVAFATAGENMAALVHEGHIGPAILAFAFSVFAICWAWINYSWLASAFDNDDLLFRIATMIQMVGVLVMALGIPALFASIDAGRPIDDSVVVAGYVVMRISTIWLWLRVARANPAWRRTAHCYAYLILVAQLGWVLQVLSRPPAFVSMILTAVLVVFEMTIPAVAERIKATPWHAHHVADRYCALVIITLGEVIAGTISDTSATVSETGWSLEAVGSATGGVCLALSLWWVYFTLPTADLLARRRGRAFVWGYGHMVVIAALAAVGAGLQVVGFHALGRTQLSAVASMLAVAIPVAIFLASLITLYAIVAGRLQRIHVLLFAIAAALLLTAIVAVGNGIGLGLGVLGAALAGVAVVAGYELAGRHWEIAAKQ